MKAKVKVSNGYTINMGNYESARIDVGVEIEGEKENLDKLWEQANEEVQTILAKELEDLRDWKKEKDNVLDTESAPDFS